MDVKSISSQSFGRLRLNETEKVLKSLPMPRKEQTITTLERAAYVLSDTEHCHVNVGPDLVPVIDINTNERYRGIFNIITPEGGTSLQFGTVYDGAAGCGRVKGDRIIVTYNTHSKESVQNFYEEIKGEKNPIILAAKIAKFIEDVVFNKKTYGSANSRLNERIDKLAQDNDYYKL